MVEKKVRQIDRFLPIHTINRTQEQNNQSLVEWAQENFYIPELSGPIKLYPYQIAVLKEAHRKDSSGKYIYNIIVWSDIKKSAKSTIAAIVALYRAYQNEWGSIKIIANDLKQADSRVAMYLRRAITLNPAMKNIRQVNYKTTLPNNTIIEAIPIDPSGEAGGNDDLIIFSELWAAKHKAIKQMWTEMTLSPTKFGYSQRWIETYAGYSGESPILEQLYERGVKDGTQLDLSYGDNDLSNLEVYAEGDMLCLWNTQPRLPWQTLEYYQSEEKTLLPSEFQRVHRNQWISSVEKFINIIWWDDCKEAIGPLTNEPLIIGLDAAKGSSGDGISDCFAMVAVSKDDKVKVRYCGIWQAGKGQLLDFAPIKEELKRLCLNHSVIEVAYDPYQLHDVAMTMRNEGVGHFREFGQSKDRLIADKQLQQLIIDRRIAHDGNPLLREHIDNANIKIQGNEGIRIIKRSQNNKIDAAVALSMAVNRILYYNV